MIYAAGQRQPVLIVFDHTQGPVQLSARTLLESIEIRRSTVENILDFRLDLISYLVGMSPCYPR